MSLVGFVQWSPVAWIPQGLVSILIFSLVITFLLTIVYKVLINKEKFDELKQKQKDFKKGMKEYANNPEKMQEIQQEMMKASMESMKITLKPMIITFIPLLITFWALKHLYMDLASIGNIIKWGANLRIVGNGGGWLFCYIVFGFIFSLIFRKIFKI